MKIKNRSRKWSHKCDGIGVRRIRAFPFLTTPLTTPSLTFRLWSSENQIVRVGSRSRRINQSQITFPRFVIGLVLLLLHPTPTICFSLDHKQNVSDGVVSRIGTLFSLDHTLYASDYHSDSDSVASYLLYCVIWRLHQANNLTFVGRIWEMLKPVSKSNFNQTLTCHTHKNITHHTLFICTSLLILCRTNRKTLFKTSFHYLLQGGNPVWHWLAELLGG